VGVLLELIASVLFDIIVEFRITRWLAGLAVMAGIAWWGDLAGLTFWAWELGILAFLLTIDNLERWSSRPTRRKQDTP